MAPCVLYVWTIPSCFTSDTHYGTIPDKNTQKTCWRKTGHNWWHLPPKKNHWIDLHNKWPCASSGVATNLMHLCPYQTTMIHELYKYLATVSSMLRYKPWCQAIQMLKCQWWVCGGLMWTVCYPCAMYATCKNKVLSIRVPIPLLFEISFYLHMFSTLVLYGGEWSAAYHHCIGKVLCYSLDRWVGAPQG